MKTNGHLCPNPAKTAYRSKKIAEQALKNKMPVLYGPIAVYQCRCGRWHLTSREQQDQP
jgi:hypothetical protein